MRRLCKITEFQRYLNARSTSTTRYHVTQATRTDGTQTALSSIISLFSDQRSPNPAEEISKRKLIQKVSELKDELLNHKEDAEKVEKILEQNGVSLFRIYSDGSAMVELLSQLRSSPILALEVLSWRRRQLDYAAPMTAEEYTKGIVMAGRLKNTDLAVELFKEASNKQLIKTSLYNALMTVYMHNGLTMRCQAVFRDLKSEPTCSPSIATYNILISAFGRLMLVDHMEAALKEIKDLNFRLNLETYKGLISGYITAWKWREMEKTYLLMKAGPIKPNVHIHLLMLRGYAHSGNLKKMEEIYKMVKGDVDSNKIPLIRTMISAYSRSTDVAKVEKIEKLLGLIPEGEYRPWVNVILICLYAKEDLLDKMEKSIQIAFERKAYITTVGIMRCIISSYFRQNALDKLVEFVHRADCAGWKICRSLYHCKMVMYSSEKRIMEMERVLGEMDRLNIPFSKKSLWILYKSYESFGERLKVEMVAGIMCKHGYGIPMDTCSS